jgi:hypothetical protein
MPLRTTRTASTAAAAAGPNTDTIVLNTQLPESAQSAQDTHNTPTALEIARLKAVLEERQL